MVAIVLAVCGMYVWGDIRVALYIGLGVLIAKALFKSMK